LEKICLKKGLRISILQLLIVDIFSSRIFKNIKNIEFVKKMNEFIFGLENKKLTQFDMQNA